MKRKQNYNIPPTEEEISRYLSGDMTDEERNAIERKLQYSSFFADAEEGLSKLGAEDFSTDINKLRQKLSERTKVKKSMWARPLQVAAALIIVVIFSWLLIEYTDVQDQITQTSIPSGKNEASDINPDSALLSYQTEDLIKEETKEQPKEDATSKTAIEDEFKQLQEEAFPTEEEEKLLEKTDKEIAITENMQLDISDLDIAELEAEAEIETEFKDDKIAERKEEVKKRSLAELERRAAGVKALQSMIAPAEEVNVKSNMIAGRILNPNDLSPIPGVNIIVKGTTIGTVSDIDGKFNLSIPDSVNNTLVFSFIGFETTEFDVKDQSYVEVTLDDDVSQLSEVVITGYGRTNNKEYIAPVVEKARPKHGFKSYKEYLLNNMHYPEEESGKRKVKVEFFVEPNGSLSDINVTNMPGKPFEEEAIRLIKEGPEWLPATVDGKAQREKVKIKMRFKPPKN